MGKTQIMVVEDERIVAKDIEMSLHKLGYSVCSLASSGEEAIRKAEENKPNLVLMDIVLQGEMSGIEAAGQIRSQFDIPVIYLTAYADKETLNLAKTTEPFGYMLKPFEEKKIHTAIEMALYKHKREKSLKERSEWLKALLNSFGDTIIYTDKIKRI